MWGFNSVCTDALHRFGLHVPMLLSPQKKYLGYIDRQHPLLTNCEFTQMIVHEHALHTVASSLLCSLLSAVSSESESK
jgi:hypothetical protein